jgi:hypothetical protein
MATNSQSDQEKPMSDQQAKIIFVLHTDQREQLDRIADRLRVSRSAVIRFAIDAYIHSFFSPQVAMNSQSDEEKPEAA